MKRIVQRLLLVVGASGILLAVAEATANAGINLTNHSEPVARDHR